MRKTKIHSVWRQESKHTKEGKEACHKCTVIVDLPLSNFYLFSFKIDIMIFSISPDPQEQAFFHMCYISWERTIMCKWSQLIWSRQKSTAKITAETTGLLDIDLYLANPAIKCCTKAHSSFRYSRNSHDTHRMNLGMEIIFFYLAGF